ncbi:MAG: NAD(P)/FAD-dependent oxidoreductase [Candidatus Diapherotrites archaeon]|nr:NAD(P)/FAD-dependent oxidoreductase [Candidatus Diapherotrites archaeon]
MDSVVIAGAGPAGLMAAIRLKELGFDATVLEEDKAVGLPENCTGLISCTGAAELGLGLKKCLVNTVRGADLVSPDGTTLAIRKKSDVAFVLDRKEFDKSLYEKALSAGIKVELNSKIIDLRQNTLFFQRKERGEIKKIKVLVGADGPLSAARKLAGINAPVESFIHTYQERVKGDFDRKKIKMYFGSFAPGFFAWVVPESESIARIGLGAAHGINPAEKFAEFRQKTGLEFETLDKKGFVIPVGPPLKSVCEQNILLVGDAAFQAKASTGGGIIMGMQSALKCAEAVADNLKDGKPLDRYNKLVSGINKDLKVHWKIRSFLNSQSDEQVNKLFSKAKNAGIESFLEEYGDMDKPSRFVGKILSKPRLWGLAGLAMRLR